MIYFPKQRTEMKRLSIKFRTKQGVLLHLTSVG